MPIAMASMPVAVISVRNGANGPVFTFLDKKYREPIEVHGVIVSIAGSDEKYCSLRTDLEGGSVLLKEWEHGSSPTGFKLLQCRPLKPGTLYTVSVMGTGVGTHSFRLDANGKVP